MPSAPELLGAHLAVWLGAYLVGAIPFGYLLARWRGVDIFEAGSGNMGATNVGRVLGKRLGVLVFLLDFAKGALPVVAALAIKKTLPEQHITNQDSLLEVGAGLAAFLGHVFPIYLRFRGGKGVATGAGVAVILLPGPALAAALAWMTVVAVPGYVSLASLAAVAVLCGVYLAASAPVDADDPRILFCALAATLVFIKHRANIVRLLQGTENKVRWAAPLRKSLHVLAMGLWFGSALFFTFVVTLSLFGTFTAIGTKHDRPAWFPLPPDYAAIDSEVHGPKEQGARAAGYALGPLFHGYFLLQGACAFIAAWTALAWARENPGVTIQRWRSTLLLLALATVLVGWPLERHVAELRGPRNDAIDAYLRAPHPKPTATVQTMQAARSEFGRWHTFSLLLNFLSLILVTGAMALAGQLPGEPVLAFPAREKTKPAIDG